MTANPATIAGDIMDRLNRAAASGNVPDQMTVARLRRDIDKLRSVDAAGGWAAESAVDSALFNDEAVVEAVRHAIRLAPNRSEVILNCTLSLTRVGRYRDALEILGDAATRIKGDATVWDRYSDVAYLLGNFSAYRSAFASWKMLTKSEGSYPRIVDVVDDFLSRNDSSEVEFSELINAAQRLLSAQKIRTNGISFMHINPIAGDHERIAVAIEVEAASEDLLRVEQSLFDRLNELSIPIEAKDLVSVRLKQIIVGCAYADQVKTTS